MPVIAAPQVARRSQPARGSYRHGDLRRALLDAGIELARDGGPDAVVLREATRRAGVVPNAAYRHFDSRDALFEAVRAAALAAMAFAMEEEIAVAERRARGPVELARARLRAVGTAYLRFARAQPGLFRTAFSPVAAGGGTAPAPATDRAGDSGLNPFELLGSALDSLTEAGVLCGRPPPRGRVPGLVGGPWDGAAGDRWPAAATERRAGSRRWASGCWIWSSAAWSSGRPTNRRERTISPLRSSPDSSTAAVLPTNSDPFRQFLHAFRPCFAADPGSPGRLMPRVPRGTVRRAMSVALRAEAFVPMPRGAAL